MSNTIIKLIGLGITIFLILVTAFSIFPIFAWVTGISTVIIGLYLFITNKLKIKK